MTKAEKHLKRLCDKFHDDIQAVFDDEMQAEGEYDNSEMATLATIAQGYAYDVAHMEE